MYSQVAGGTAYEHVNGHLAVDVVHVYVTSKSRLAKIPIRRINGYAQFIETADRRAHGFP